MLTYVIVGAIVGAFIGVVYYLGMKQNAADAEIAEKLPEDVKKYLMETPMQPVDGIPNGAAVAGYVHEIKKKNEKNSALTVVYYNQYFPSLRDKIITADVKVSNEDLQKHNISEKSYVTMLFNEDKSPKLIFEN